MGSVKDKFENYDEEYENENEDKNENEYQPSGAGDSRSYEILLNEYLQE